MLELKVEGMTCQHCVRAVTGAVHTVRPEAKIAVDLETGMVRIEPADPADAPRIEAAITEEGYAVRKAA